MAIIDTNIVIERIRKKEEIKENITIVTLIEHPRISRYKKFYGKVLLPGIDDFELAYNIQLKLTAIGKLKPFADLLIAAICINRNEELITKDKDFLDIAKVSNLKVKVIE